MAGRAVGVWRSVFVAAPAEGAEAHGLRAELEAAARRLEIACRQARLLAQAALAPLKDLPEAAALLVPKTKRRGGRSSDEEDTHPILEQDPPDPAAPTPEEAAEIAASRASGESEGAERAAPSASRVES